MTLEIRDSLRKIFGPHPDLFRTKSIGELLECCAGEHTLKRVLGPFELVLFGIGAIIGTGIFVITGIAAANYAGPALVLSFVISGIVCLLAALAYAEFATMVPIAGSAYSYELCLSRGDLGLDYRVGPDPGIFCFGGRGSSRMVGVYHEPPL